MRRLFWFSQIHVSPGLQHGPASFSSCMAILGAGILPEWHALARSPYENKPLDDFNVIGVPPWKGGFHIAQELWSLVDFPWYSWSFLSWYGQSKEAYVQAITRVSNIDIYSWATHRHHLKARAGRAINQIWFLQTLPCSHTITCVTYPWFCWLAMITRLVVLLCACHDIHNFLYRCLVDDGMMFSFVWLTCNDSPTSKFAPITRFWLMISIWKSPVGDVLIHHWWSKQLFSWPMPAVTSPRFSTQQAIPLYI